MAHKRIDGLGITRARNLMVCQKHLMLSATFAWEPDTCLNPIRISVSAKTHPLSKSQHHLCVNPQAEANSQHQYNGDSAVWLPEHLTRVWTRYDSLSQPKRIPSLWAPTPPLRESTSRSKLPAPIQLRLRCRVARTPDTCLDPIRFSQQKHIL